MNKLIVPPWNRQSPEMDAEDAMLKERYNKEPELRAIADKIHHHRMMPPPTCVGCIRMAVTRLEGKRARG